MNRLDPRLYRPVRPVRPAELRRRAAVDRLSAAVAAASWGILIAACAAGSTDAATVAVVIAGAASLPLVARSAR